MALVGGGLVNVDGDIWDRVREEYCLAESGVGAGTTITDASASRFLAALGGGTAAGERIDLNVRTHRTTFCWAVRFVWRGTDGSGYQSLMSRGAINEMSTQLTMGWTEGGYYFYYGASATEDLLGSEGVGPEMVSGQVYTLVACYDPGDSQLFLCGPDIGGAGTHAVAVASGGTPASADGGQHTWIGGPNSFGSAIVQDASPVCDVIGFLEYDERKNAAFAATLGASATAFYTELPADNEPSGSGPTIDTQPVADTVLINGDAARASASFTVAASGTGTLSYQWELETSVGGGVYANVADGSGATWAGATTTNLTATFTVKTLTGRRVRCVVTDDNGSTTSSAVALTVYTGPVISKSSGTTNASGVDTLTITSDYPNADGEFTVVTATAGGVTKQVALHYETPP